MPLVKSVEHIFEPNSLACGQAVLSMLSGIDVQNIIEIVGTDREITLKDLKGALDTLRIGYNPQKQTAYSKEDLPQIAVLSLETPKCWHWSLYFKGKFYDPEYGVLDDFPISNRKYYFEIKGDKND